MPAKNPKPTEEAGLYFRHGVGTSLRLRREELGLTVTDIAKETNINRRYLEAIENSNWAAIPHTIHMLGFIRQYARLLSLDSSIAVTKYLLERGPLATLKASRPAHQRIRSAIVGSRLIIGITIAAAVIGVALYLLLQISVLAAPPALDISSPSADQQVSSPQLEIRGKTAPTASVSINNSAIPVNDDGSFSTTLTLNDGLNTVRFEARNRAGKARRVERNILLKH